MREHVRSVSESNFEMGIAQRPSLGKVWGIVLAGGEGTRVRSFLQQLCGGKGINEG